MLRRRARAAEISTDVCNHSFRATGITAFLENPVARVEVAQYLAGHADPKTTMLYDRRADRVSLDEIGRIGICEASSLAPCSRISFWNSICRKRLCGCISQLIHRRKTDRSRPLTRPAKRHAQPNRPVAAEFNRNIHVILILLGSFVTPMSQSFT